MNKKAFIFAGIAYILFAFLDFTLLYLFPQYWSIFILIYAVIFAAITILLVKYYKKHILRKDNDSMVNHLLSNINAIAAIWSEDFSYIKVNDLFCTVSGYTKEECENVDIFKTILPVHDITNVQKNISECTLVMTRKDKSTIEINWNSSHIHTGLKKLIFCIGFDNTEAFLMREKLYDFSKNLKDTQNKYSLSMELSEIGIILKNTDSNSVYISEQFKNMMGIYTDTMTVKELRDRVHPNDRVLFDTYSQSSTYSENEEINSAEMRILSADSTYHWYLLRYKTTKSLTDNSLTVGGAIFDVTKEKAKDSLIEKMAYIDEITQIYNRNKFMEIGDETFTCSLALNIQYWVIVLDIDKFHIINDTCGYKNGNILLRNIAAVILNNVNEGGFAARISGDNFALIIKDTGDENLPVKTINLIQNQLNKLAVDVFSTQTITCSAGYCKMPADADNFAKILDHAEFALGLNEDQRGSISRYDPLRHENILASSIMEQELAKALYNDELILYYQPKINLDDGNIIGAEALIRWKKPDGSIVPPSLFIPVAENSMLITKISNFVLNEACRQNKKWQDEGFQKFSVAVNLTSVDFYQTNIIKLIQNALNTSGLAAKWLEVELTESLALKDVDLAILQMKELIDLGIKLSMDDFGTGYSSLSYIQVLPITLLKLDRSFIMYLEEDEVSREIVSAVIKIAKSKKIKTIAEGIETPGQAEILRKSGCDQAQGYFFGKPMPVDEFENFLNKRKKQPEMIKAE